MYEDRNGTDIYYYYDSLGTPTSIKYYEPDGTNYRFYLATNQLGDVIGLYNTSGNLVVKYEYDAWGNIIAETNANGDSLNSLSQKWSDINPFRYRGYYYDSETGLYYLQSRYYDAETGRFINSDSLLDSRKLLGFNTFAYCGNNPVMGYDPAGHWDWGGFWTGVGTIIVGAVVTFGGAYVGSPDIVNTGLAMMTTGGTMIYAAATDSQMVIDVSGSVSTNTGTYVKGGASVIVDFEDDNVQVYGHAGVGKGSSNGVSYSVGVVKNYEEPSDYSKDFIDVNAYYKIGVDHCWNPFNEHDSSVQATCITFSSGFGYGVGYDYYFKPIQLFEW